MVKYAKQDNPDILRHIKDDSIHPRKIDGGMPVGAENQTIRHNATVWESTDVLKTYTTGAMITTDHPMNNTSAFLIMVVPVAEGEAEPDAADYPEGTLMPIYEV